jgi:hypothetical protein
MKKRNAITTDGRRDKEGRKTRERKILRASLQRKGRAEGRFLYSMKN